MLPVAMVVGAYLYNPQVPPPLGLDVAFWPEFWAPLQPLDASGWLLQPLLMPANPAVLSATSAVFQCLFFDANTGTLECSDAIRVSYGF